MIAWMDRNMSLFQTVLDLFRISVAWLVASLMLPLEEKYSVMYNLALAHTSFVASTIPRTANAVQVP